jgi:peroxiredoxin
MQMIRLFIAVIALSIIGCDNTPDSNTRSFHISGSIEGAGELAVELYTYVDQKLKKVDSTVASNGTFEFNGETDQARLYMVKIGSAKPFELFVIPGEITLNGDISNLDAVEVNGSEEHEKFQDYRDTMALFDAQLENKYPEWLNAQKNNDSVAMQAIEAEYRSIYEQQQAYLKNFISTEPNSHVSAYLTYRMLYDSGFETLDSIYNLFSPEVRNGIYGQMIADRVAVLQKVAVGQPLPEFEQTDTAGNLFNSSELKGKYVLIDFWASWCSPCRAENPNIVAAYEKYHSMGFEVLGISLDQDRVKWLKAIEDDGLSWTQLSDLKGWNNEVSQMFGIRAIPHSILINPDGQIIAKDLRGDALNQKLEEIYDTAPAS